MAIDAGHEPEPIGPGLQGGYLPMWIGTAGAWGLGIGPQPMAALVGGAPMQDGHRSRCPVDTAGRHDTVIGRATDVHALQAGHG